MATEIINSRVRDWRGIGTASGTALTTSAAYITFPHGTQYITMTPRNFSTAVVARFALCPYGAVLLRRGAFNQYNVSDFSRNAQDGSTATTIPLNALGLLAAGNMLYIGAAEPYRGVRVTMHDSEVNAVTSVLTVSYWSVATNSWVDISDTDGTISGTATLGQTGNVTWTVPASTLWGAVPLWKTEGLPAMPAEGIPHGDAPLYWTRWEVSVAVTDPTTVTGLLLLNRSTAYAELILGQTLEEAVHVEVGGQAGVEALTDAGTGNLVVNGAIVRDSGRFT